MIITQKSKYALKESVQFTCTGGKILRGDASTITCDENAEFSEFQFSCEDQCLPLPEIQFARPIVNIGNQPIGSIVTFLCKSQNNNPMGDPTIRCLPDGSWTKPNFSCNSACHGPLTILNSKQIIIG